MTLRARWRYAIIGAALHILIMQFSATMGALGGIVPVKGKDVSMQRMGVNVSTHSGNQLSLIASDMYSFVSITGIANASDCGL